LDSYGVFMNTEPGPSDGSANPVSTVRYEECERK